MANDKQPAPPAPIAIPLRWIKVTHKTPDHIAARYPYAAYGSNLALGQMAHRCPQADPMGAAILRSARLVFARYLGILSDDNATVPIGVYRLTGADIATLDRYEGLGRSYDRYLVTVEMDGQAVRCFTYIKRHNEPESPSESYYATCLQGFSDWGFDSRRLRHARDYARKHEKPVPRKYKNWQNIDWEKRTYGAQFDFDDWYKSTYPTRRSGNGTAADGAEFIPEDSDRTPHTSLVTGRLLTPRKRYEDMRPDEIKESLSNREEAVFERKRAELDGYPEGATFTGRNGQRWIKGAHNVWRRAKPD